MLFARWARAVQPPGAPGRRPRGQQRAVADRPHPHPLRPRTRAFVAKRTATGNSRKEIMRMLQRYLARELYPLIISALQPAAADHAAGS